VARNVVKRVVREAARHRAAHLDAALGARSLDILFRLKAPLPEPSAAGWALVKAQLRREADSLLVQLLDRVRTGSKGPPGRTSARTKGHGGDSLAQSAGGGAAISPLPAGGAADDALQALARKRA
jgi:hypothetical protein